MSNTFAVVDKNTNLVTNIILWDGESDFSVDDDVILVETDSASVGWSYENNNFTPPKVIDIPMSDEDNLLNNTNYRDQLLRIATLAITPLQYAIDLDISTEAEEFLTKEWKKFMVETNRVDLNSRSPVWPIAPV